MMRQQNNKKATYTAIDLFAGGGGLTVGLKASGFSVVGAVEIEQHAYSTYKANHPEVTAFRQDIRTITGESLLNLSPNGSIDLIAGCPPCQGFSSLTSKYKGKRDSRNTLVREMGRLADEVRPRIVMMENVPGLYTKPKGRRYFNELIKKLTELGYVCTHDVLQVADYGVPQSRRRLVLLAGLGFNIELPQPTHDRLGREGKKTWTTVKTAIGNKSEPKTLEQTKKTGGPAKEAWHVVRTLSDKNIKRLAASMPGQGWSQIPAKLRPNCHQDEGTGFSNVYGRMEWEKVSPSITGGCTTLSKGRFGHPEKLRTISVREAALLQTFPEDYIIDTPYMEHACTIIGNALPCRFAEALARHCLESLP